MRSYEQMIPSRLAFCPSRWGVTSGTYRGGSETYRGVTSGTASLRELARCPAPHCSTGTASALGLCCLLSISVLAELRDETGVSGDRTPRHWVVYTDKRFICWATCAVVLAGRLPTTSSISKRLLIVLTTAVSICWGLWVSVAHH